MADTNTVPTWVAIVSTLLGGGLVGIFNFITNLINKRSEERKHLQTLMFNAALENWKQSCILALEKAKKGNPSNVLPLDSYIVHMIKLSEVLTTGKLNKENIQDKLKEITAVTSIATQYAKDLDKPRKDSPVKKDDKPSHPFGDEWNKTEV